METEVFSNLSAMPSIYGRARRRVSGTTRRTRALPGTGVLFCLALFFEYVAVEPAAAALVCRTHHRLGKLDCTVDGIAGKRPAIAVIETMMRILLSHSAMSLGISSALHRQGQSFQHIARRGLSIWITHRFAPEVGGREPCCCPASQHDVQGNLH